MKHTLKWCIPFAFAMVFASCSTIRTASDYDKNINFSKLKSYNYYDKGIDRLDLNNLDKPRMLDAVETSLKKVGFIKAEHPDFLVNVVVFTNVKIRSDWGYSGGGYQWDVASSAYRWNESQFGPLNTDKEYAEGTIIIDFLNPRTKAIIWHGIGKGFNFDNYYDRELRMNSAVKQILIQYPPIN